MSGPKSGCLIQVLLYFNNLDLNKITKTINVNDLFEFSKITSDETLREINNLENKKAGSWKNIPTKILKQSSEIGCEYLTKIWNEQVIIQKDFQNELKLAITSILKKENSLLAKL